MSRPCTTALTLTDYQARLSWSVEVAREAGEVTLEHFRSTGLAVEQKSDASPVTVADRAAETLLRERIAEAYPDDAILGEEFGETAGASGFRWILDPIDGTKSFIYGVPLYGTLIGLEHGGKSVLGVINLPAMDECVYAAEGLGAWHRLGDGQPRPARVSTVEGIGDALLLTSDLEGFAATDTWPVIQQLSAAARITRTWGDCFGYLLVATGRAEVMIDPRMHVWDAAALQPIIQEAGGAFSDWNGNPSIYSGHAVATNGLVTGDILTATANWR